MPNPAADRSETNVWRSPELARNYLAMADSVAHRTEGEAALLEVLPARVERVLDLGCGDGRLGAIVLAAHPAAGGLAVDFSEVMLGLANERFAGSAMAVAEHDLAEPLVDGPVGASVDAHGPFDTVVSSFAIHHLTNTRKRALYGEILAVLRPGGVFANLEHVASATARRHDEFMAIIGESEDEDPSNILAPVEAQLEWLRDLGYVEVDNIWRWRELALLVGEAPAVGGAPSR